MWDKMTEGLMKIFDGKDLMKISAVACLAGTGRSTAQEAMLLKHLFASRVLGYAKSSLHILSLL